MRKDPRRSERRILIVDDEPKVVGLLEAVLRAEGYRTFPATTAQEAVEVSARTRFDLVLLDLLLPDGNGLEVLRVLKEMNPEVQVIVMTAFGSSDTVRTAMEMGAFEYFTKPFDCREFCDAIEGALALGHALVPA